jgi:hypothetical protein
MSSGIANCTTEGLKDNSDGYVVSENQLRILKALKPG